MEAAAAQRSAYWQDFAARRKERQGEPVWLIERRQAAIAAFEAAGFPSKRNEAWRNLDLSSIAGRHFAAAHVSGDGDALAAALMPALGDAWRLVFVDGHYMSHLSDLAGLPAGVTVQPLGEALPMGGEALIARLGVQAPAELNPFSALNGALFEDGALVQLGRGVALERPIAVVFLNSERAAGHAVYPRLLVAAEEGAQARIIEAHRGAAGAYLSCPVTELTLAANARLDYHKLQEEGAEAFHFASVSARLERDAGLRLHSLALGGRTARTDIQIGLSAPGAEAELDGLYLTRDGQYQDHHTLVEHSSEHCNSRQRFKGVLMGKSEAVFDGLVRVTRGAQKTDARQENRNLLLSKRALAHSNPRLEIFADDVKCSHGSTVGELDREALFYLRARGIGVDDAQGLLTQAFIGEVLDAVTVATLRDYGRRAVLGRLPGASVLEEGV